MMIALIATACGGSSGGNYTSGDYTSAPDDYTSEETDSGEDTSDYDGAAESVTEETTVLGSGVYAFYNAAENRYLAYTDRTLVLSEDPVSWEVKASGSDGVYIYGEEINLLFDIDNAYIHQLCCE